MLRRPIGPVFAIGYWRDGAVLVQDRYGRDIYPEQMPDLTDRQIRLVQHFAFLLYRRTISATK